MTSIEISHLKSKSRYTWQSSECIQLSAEELQVQACRGPLLVTLDREGVAYVQKQ